MSIQTFRPTDAQTLVDFYFWDMHGLLNVNAMPQSIDDSDLSIAQNVYGSQVGGVYVRKGMALRGSALTGATHIDGLFRFEQQTINGVSQNPSVVYLLAQSAGNFYNYDANSQIGAGNVLGNAANPWSVEQVYDPDHTLPTPAPPTAGAPSAGGSLSAGTYLGSMTWLSALGETLASTDVTITGVPGSGQVVITRSGPPPTGAVSWNFYGSNVAGGNRSTERLQNASPIAVATTTFTWSAQSGSSTAIPVSNTALAASDVMVICTGVGGPYAYDGSIVYVPAAWNTNAPSARWCEVVNDILFFGGIPSQPNLIVGMQLGHPETLPTGGQNNFQLSHPVSGLGIFGAGATAGLAVGMTQGLSIIYGSGPSNFYLQEVPAQDGVAAGRTMMTVDGLLYFLGRDDYYKFDGNNIIPLGTKIRPYILNDPLFNNPWDLPMSGSRSLSWSMYYNKRIYVWFDSGNVGNPNAGIVWDLVLQGWTTYTGVTLQSAALLNASSDGAPLAIVVGDATTNKAYNFDVYNGTGHNVDDAGTAINVFALSKYFKIGQPGTNKRLMRLYPEFFSELMSALIIADTDYGSTSQANVVNGLPTNAAIWDTSKWDQANWASGYLTFINPRTDLDVYFEALAIGVQSNAVQAPYWFQGCSGRISQNTRT